MEWLACDCKVSQVSQQPVAKIKQQQKVAKATQDTLYTMLTKIKTRLVTNESVMTSTTF